MKKYKIIIEDKAQFNTVCEALELKGYTVPSIPDAPIYALIIDTRYKKAKIQKKRYYDKNGSLLEYHSDVEIVDVSFFQVKKKKKGRLGTGRAIRRSDGAIYKDINELMSNNPQAAYTAKIYKAIKAKRPVYDYYWEYMPDKHILRSDGKIYTSFKDLTDDNEGVRKYTIVNAINSGKEKFGYKWEYALPELSPDPLSKGS